MFGFLGMETPLARLLVEVCLATSTDRHTHQASDTPQAVTAGAGSAKGNRPEFDAVIAGMIEQS